ncbi:MAG: hypothetical protein KF767_18825 [Bdellovibrionaceae bacterium]|nr:hypothetical protein [Pseudobdellovibrionaceae bacterium]
MKWFIGGLILGVSFIGGFSYIIQSHQPTGEVAVMNRSARTPAAIRKVYDFSELDGNALNQASKQRLMAGFEVTRDQSDIGVRLGHFVVAGQDGEKVFACDRFDRVVLSFEGEGVATNGDKPQMEVEGQCEPDQDVNRISPLWIPVARITADTVHDGEQIYQNRGQDIRVKFANVSDQWPPQWVLTSIRLKNAGHEDVTIESTELRQMMDRPVVVEF